VELINDCVAAIRRGNTLIIFPEGTRTPADGSISLKRGAANIAVRASRNITPVLIRCQPAMLAKGVKWWRLPSQASEFKIEVKEDIDIQPFLRCAGSEALAARHLTEHLHSYFTKEIGRHAVA
jgi:1-acyl-sn-glycerol-3-phosphate acyltransferase